MKKTLKSCTLGGALLGGVLGLWACGDDVTKVSRNDSGMDVVESMFALGMCDSSSIGKMRFAQNENAVYLCADTGWTSLSEKSEVECSAEQLSDSSGYKIVCGEDSVGVLLSGKKGATGKAGEKGATGEEGASCTAELLGDSSGYKIVCGKDSVGFLPNGTDGSGCSLTDNGDGTVSQVCESGTVTLYKAYCGKKEYDPEKAFCFEDSTYACGEVPFNPGLKFCYADSIYTRCGKSTYDPSNQICLRQKVYGLFLDTRDNQIYRTITLGTQTWMAENLNYETENSYCYNDDTANCAKYGRLYTWNAAKTACPDSFHLPSFNEWETLNSFVSTSIYNGKTDNIGYALKSTSGWSNYNGKSGNGSDTLGFEALPAGVRTPSGKYTNISTSGYFWSSTLYGSDAACTRNLYYFNTVGSTRCTVYDPISMGISVRCVKN